MLHGGEPLLAGPAFLHRFGSTVHDAFASSGVRVSLGMQSNGLLFSEDIGHAMLEQNLSIGISIDGPPAVNDLHRVDHQGRPSTRALEEKLRMLLSPAYRRLFRGFLCVVDVSADPLEVFEYLASFEPPGIDFLLPYDNYDNRPPGKDDLNSTLYADWLIAIFDAWFRSSARVPVRMFDSLLRLVMGGSSLVESVGLDAVDLLVVEANGQIEAVDSLKAAFDGATYLGYNVFDHSIDAALQHASIKTRQAGAAELCGSCRACPVVRYCGGGYLPNRYSAERGFDNPSIYCSDLHKLIRHVHAAAAEFVPTEPAVA